MVTSVVHPTIAFLAKRPAEVLVKIGIVATVTVGGMDAAVEPSGMSLWRVTGETMTIHPTHPMTNSSKFGAKVSEKCSER